MRKAILFCIALSLAVVPVRMFPQDNKPAEKQESYYRLSFAVQEVNDAGKVTNSRTYTTAIGTGPGPYAQIRTGDKVPLRTDDKGNLNYVDVGVNIDCSRAQEANGKLALQITADVSSTTKSADTNAPPIIRQNKWSANVMVPVGKPTTILSSDDLQGKGKMQVELTATRIE